MVFVYGVIHLGYISWLYIFVCYCILSGSLGISEGYLQTLFYELQLSVEPSLNAFQSAIRPAEVISSDSTFSLMRTAKSFDVDQNIKVAQLDGIAAVVDCRIRLFVLGNLIASQGCRSGSETWPHCNFISFRTAIRPEKYFAVKVSKKCRGQLAGSLWNCLWPPTLKYGPKRGFYFKNQVFGTVIAWPI